MADALLAVPVFVACRGIAKKNNRQILGKKGSVSQGITLLWDSTIQKEPESRKVHLDVDGFVSSGMAYMCRKCHYAYEKFMKVREVSSWK